MDLLRPIFAVALLTTASPQDAASRGAAGAGDLASLTPPGAVAFAEAPDPAAAWRALERLGVLERWGASPSYAEALRTPQGIALAAGLAALRAVVGSDAVKALTGLAGDGAAVAAWAPAKPGGKPDYLLAARGRDPELMRRTRDAAAEAAGLMAAGDWIPENVKLETRSFGSLDAVELVTRSDGTCHALAGRLFVASNRKELLTGALSLASGAKGASLAESPSFRAASPKGNGAYLWIDVDAGAAANPVLRDPEAGLEPVPGLLFGGFRQAFVDSSWVLLTLGAEGKELVLETRTAVKPKRSVKAFLPARAPSPGLRVPRHLGTLVLRRDLEAFWNDHEGAVAPEFDPDFAKFNTVAAAILGVKRLDEDVLGKLEPAAQWVLARQTYSDLREPPKVKIPAIGVVARMKQEDKKLADGLRRAFQTAVAIGSADRAQKEMTALGLGEETLDGVKITYAEFPEPEDGEPVGPEHNASPAFFTKGRWVVVASTRELAADLVKTLTELDAAPPEAPPPATLDLLELDSRGWQEALTENLDALAAQAILEGGKTKSQARRELRFVHDLMALFASARVELREEGDGLAVKASLVVADPPRTGAESRPRQATR
jgi:hypothetical protein